MKKIISFFFITFLVGSTNLLKSQNYVWARSFGSPTYDDWRATAIDAAGNVIAVGSFSGTVDFDPGAGVYNLTATAGGDDIFIMKLTSAGNFVWARRLGTTTDEVAADVICDASSNIYVVGSFNGTVDFDPGAGVTNLTSAGSSDVCMFKLNSLGNFVWARNMGGTGSDWASAIDIDNLNANVYITGTFIGTADFNPSATTNNLVIRGGQDIFVGKYDVNGNYVWAQSMGGTVADYGYDLKVDNLNNYVYCTGIFAGTTVTLSPGCSCPTYTSQGGSDFYVVKLTCSGGGFNSAAVMGGTGTDYGVGITLDANSNVFVCGQFSAACDMDPGPLNQSLGSLGSADAFVLKLNSTLAYQWAKQIGGINTQSAPECVLDPGGNVYVTGSFDGVVDFDPNAGTYTLQAQGTNQDCYVLKWDNNGNFVWAKSFGSNNLGDYASDIDLDTQGNVYTIGSFWSTVDFNPDAGVANLTSVGQTDGYIQKLSCTLPSTVTTTASNYTLCAGTVTTSPLTLSSIEPLTNYGWSVVGASGVSFSPTTGTNTSMSFTASNTFSVIVTATNACGTTTTSVNRITVNPLPTVTGVASPTAVCTGSLLTLNGAGASTYTWSSGVSNGVAFTPTATQVYTVTGTNSNNCVNSGTINVALINNPTVTISGKNLVCLNKPQVLTGNGASTYTWSPGTVVNQTISVTPTVNTVYTVSATGSNGCRNSATFTVNLVNPPTPDICQVTVDSLSVNNEIYWEKTLYPSADSFIVYREVSLNTYKRIASVHKSAFSMYVDTNRSVGPANGDPNLTYYKYKLQLRDSCGNYSAMSKWHETIFIQDQMNGNFNWNSYAIESSVPPVTIYNVKRRTIATGTETLIASTVGNLANDPFYSSFWPLGVKWFVDASGFNCNATAKYGVNSPMVLKTKTRSNQSNDKIGATSIADLNALASRISIYPNPANSVMNIDLNSLPKSETTVDLVNTLGQTVYSVKSLNQHLVINTESFAAGVYMVQIKQNDKIIAVKKAVIER